MSGAAIRQVNQVVMPFTGGLVVLMATLLACAGLVIVTSASLDFADRYYSTPFYFMQRHLVYLMMALLAGCVAYWVPMSVWQRSSSLLLIVAYVLLIVVLLPGVGKTVKGSTRWISLGIITVQVSEIVKICVLAYVSGYLVRRRDEVMQTFWGFIKPVLALAALLVLLLMQPDFGAVVVMMSAVFGMLFLAGVRFSQFLLVILGCVAAGAALILSSEYRFRRLTGYVDPWADQFSSGYQLVQSLIAFGRGEWFGVGLGNSVQKLFYLPEAHTDFVFAIWTEEFGLLGAALIIIGYALLLFGAMRIARCAEKRQQLFNAYLGYGIAIILGLQAYINMGVSTGLLPTKGLTLPLFSYGGSSLIINVVMIAMLLRIHRENRLYKPAQAKEST